MNISTSKLHYVKVPTNHVVIDFDIKDENGNKGRAGMHLHYIYDGDVKALSRDF